MKRLKNQIQLIGNMGSDMNKGTATNGSPFVYFSLAEDGKTKLNPQTQQKEKVTRWHDCVAWGENLSNLLGHLKKGDKLLVSGQLDYDHQEIDGKPRKFPKIVVSDFIYMSEKPTAS